MPKNPGAAVAAPGVQGPKPERPCAAFGQAAQGRRTSSLVRGKPSKPISASAHSADDIPNAPHRNGRACGATPRLAAAGCTKACRPRRWRFVACTSRRTVHRHATRPCNGASTPRLKQEAACYVRGAFTLSLGVVLARVRAQAGEAVTRGAESAMFPFGAGRPKASCLFVNPGGGRASMAATFQRKQFPLRCAHSSRDKFFSLPGAPLRCARKRCSQPVPRRSDHNKDAMGANLVQP